MANQDGPIDEFGQFLSDFRQRRLITNVFVVDAMDVARLKWNTDGGLYDLFHVDRSSVGLGADEGVLDDSIVVGRGPGGLEVEGQHLLSFEKVLCHEQQAQGTPFEHHSQTS